MKKNLLLICLLTVLHFNVNAQNYSFSNSTGGYSNLTSPTVLSSSGWDDAQYTIPIGFSFTFNNVPYTSIEVETNGIIYFDETLPQAVIAYDSDFEDLGNTTLPSTVGYSLSGAAGSRILKIEWKNAKFYDGNSTDYANFQVWLYEGGSNKIEIHFGPEVITNPSAIFGSAGGTDHGLAFMIDEINETFSGYLLQGSPASPTAVAFNNAPLTAFVVLNAPPTNGTIYTFRQGSVGIKEQLNNPAISVFPNPVTDVLHIKGLQAENEVSAIRVFDVLGKLVYETTANNLSVIPVNISSLRAGTYYVEIVSGEKRIAKRFVKK